MIKKFFIICGLILSLSLVNAGTTDPSIDDSKYIQYGQKFEYVGKIHGIAKDKKMFYGSCVAHTKNIVLTAAHIANDIDSANITINNKTFKIIKSIPHPLFNNLGRNYDIAICLVEGDIDLDWFPPLYKKHDELNKICCMAGYGVTGKFNSSKRTDDQKRRAGSNKIDSVQENILTCNASKNNKTELEFLISHGDSGGGLFIDGHLAGINSSIEQIFINSILQNDYRTTSSHVRISNHIDWIENTIKSLNNQEK